MKLSESVNTTMPSLTLTHTDHLTDSIDFLLEVSFGL
jgi:hypothetical protein